MHSITLLANLQGGAGGQTLDCAVLCWYLYRKIVVVAPRYEIIIITIMKGTAWIIIVHIDYTSI